MAGATLAQLEADLAEVSASITRILNSNTQEFWVGGTERHRAPELSVLIKERQRLREEIEAISGSAAVFAHIAVVE